MSANPFVDADGLGYILFEYHTKSVYITDFSTDKPIKQFKLPHKLLTGKCVQGTLITIGTSPETVHFMDLTNDDISTQKVKATLGCLCSLDIEPLYATEAAVITTAGLSPLILAVS